MTAPQSDWLEHALAQADGRRCCSATYGGGLTLPDGRERCFWHAEAADVELVDDLDSRARGIGLPRRPGPPRWGRQFRWPTGADVVARQRLLAWAEPQELKFANLRSGACPHWPRNYRRCPTWAGGTGGGWATCTRGSWRDHVTLWKQDGAPALYLAQPYHLDESDLVELQAIDLDDHLAVTVRGVAPWYSPRALSVEVWRASARQGSAV